MRIPICLRGERAASMHFVKVWGARDCPREGPCTDKPLSRRRISIIACDGGYLDVKVCVFQVQRKKSVPWTICERICFSMIILNDLFMRARFRCLRLRIGRRPPSFWGRGSNGCRSLTHSGLEGPFLRCPLPAKSSPQSAGRVRSCSEQRWEPRC